MPRKPIIYTNEHPYHVIGRSNNCDWFDLPLNYCYGIFSDVLIQTKINYEFKLHAFILMNNHYHMIISTPHSNISRGMRYFMTETARGIRVKAKRINHVYGGRYIPSLIKTPEYYAHCIKYIYRNPVKAGIVKQVEDYNWSTIASEKTKLSAQTELTITGHDCCLPQEQSEQLKWFNSPNEIELDRQISRALHRIVFDLKPDRNTRRAINLLDLTQRPRKR